MGLLRGRKWLFGASSGEGGGSGQEEDEKTFRVSQFGLGSKNVGFGLPQFCFQVRFRVGRLFGFSGRLGQFPG